MLATQESTGALRTATIVGENCFAGSCSPPNEYCNWSSKRTTTSSRWIQLLKQWTCCTSLSRVHYLKQSWRSKNTNCFDGTSVESNSVFLCTEFQYTTIQPPDSYWALALKLTPHTQAIVNLLWIMINHSFGNLLKGPLGLSLSLSLSRRKHPFLHVSAA